MIQEYLILIFMNIYTLIILIMHGWSWLHGFALLSDSKLIALQYHQPKARASEARNPSWSCRKSSALLRSKIILDISGYCISGCHWNSAIWQNSVGYCKQINMKNWSSWSTASNMFTSDFLSYPLSPLCFVMFCPYPSYPSSKAVKAGGV